MKIRGILVRVVVLAALLSVLAVDLSDAQEPAPQVEQSIQASLGTGFTYQGRLLEGGAPAEGSYDFEFRLFDAASLGNPVGSLVGIVDQPVVEGRFTVLLDFGGVFDGARLWLEAAVRPGDSSGAFTTLSPRQPLTAAPAAHSLRPGASIVGSLGNEAVIRAQNTSLDAQSSGLYGQSDSPEGAGVYGVGSNGGYGVYGLTMATGSDNTPAVYGQSGSPEGRGVYGYATSDTGLTYGVYGRSRSPEGMGVRGYASAESGLAYGVYGKSDSTDGAGVYGLADAASGANHGVYGQTGSIDGVGVAGFQPGYGDTDLASFWKPGGLFGGRNGVAAVTKEMGGYGVVGVHQGAGGSGSGVYGQTDSTYGRGVYGLATATTGTNYGLYGQTDSADGYGVYGFATATSGTNYGVYGLTNSSDGYAGYFVGDVYVNGDLASSGTSLKIDHPLDPANQYLNHYSVESAERLNQYTGNVTLDEDGQAWVELPAWFEATNADIRYQLTCIGGFAPVYIAQEVQDNRFQIAGGQPGLKVSWMVTAVRNDPYAQQHPPVVEQDKPEAERGTYLDPELYGQPEETGIGYLQQPGGVER